MLTFAAAPTEVAVCGNFGATSTAIHLLILIPPICSQIATKLKTTGLERKNDGQVKNRVRTGDSLFNLAADQ